MSGMFLGRVRKDDYVIEINETRLPPQPGEEDIYCKLNVAGAFRNPNGILVYWKFPS
jgi:hypothetical protein